MHATQTSFDATDIALQPRVQTAPAGREALFFSYNKSDGTIGGCNATFQQFSQYQTDEILGAPIALIRHPDMPLGLFHLMHQTLANGDPFGAYVKNRAKDGASYWVYSVSLPVDDGHLSVRLVPCEEQTKRISALYKDVRTQEENGLKPEASAALLVQKVQDAGFERYQDFMHDALETEYSLRAKLMGRAKTDKHDQLVEVHDGIAHIRGLIRKVDDTFKEAHQIPFNMRLQAGRLEGTSGPISVISTNHREMTQRLETAVQQFRGAKGLREDLVKEASFNHCAGNLLREMADVYAPEGLISANEGQENMMPMMQERAAWLDQQASTLVASIADRIAKFSGICRDISRLMSGLELTRIMCKIERSKQVSGTDGLDEIIHRLGEAQNNLSTVLTAIEKASSETLRIANVIAMSVEKRP